jgi:hypothetical protein
MFLYLLHSQTSNSLRSISFQHATNQAPHLFTSISWKFQSRTSYIIKHLIHILIVVGRFAHNHFIQNTPNAINVGGIAVTFFL